MSLVTKLYKWQYSPTYTNECGHIWRSSLNYTVIMLIHDSGHQTIQMTMTNKLYRWHCSLNYTLIMLNHDNVHQTIQMTMLTTLYRWQFPPTYTIFELFWAPKKAQIFAITLVIKLYKKRKIYPTTCISMFTKLYKKQRSLNYTNDRVHQPIQML